MRSARIVALPGDGIGPEITAEATACLRRVIPGITIDEHLIGGAAIDRHGDPAPSATLEACRQADAVLLGAVGGPKWEGLPPARRPERGLLALRTALGVWANLRPVRTHPAQASASPLRPELLRDVDVLFVRELLGGIYFGEPRGTTAGAQGLQAVDTMRYSEWEIERVTRRAFDLARTCRRRVTSVDKANVLDCSRLWRAVVEDVSDEYRDVEVEHRLVDSFAFELLLRPATFDVVLCPNLFGDILSDEAAALAGTLGVLPSASVGDDHGGLFEPIHGSAPELAGTGHANPIGVIASTALLCRHALGQPAAALALERAIDATLGSGCLTPDLGGTASTAEVGAAIRHRLEPCATTSVESA